METEKIVYYPPEQILVEDNIRYEISKVDVDALKEDILQQGRVTTPLEVEPLSSPIDGKKVKLTVGFRRHRAVEELNKDQKAGLALPVIVRALSTPMERLKRQLSENVQRKNLSPMDIAVSAKKMLDAGASRLEVREAFKRPGGKKLNVLQPQSNAWLNMHLSFLELAKDIRSRIHDGRVGVAAAYELTKVPAERQAEILSKAEASREAALEREAKEEEKFLESQKKVEVAEQELTQTVTQLDHAKAEVELAEKALHEKQEEAKTLYATAKSTKDKEARKKVEEKLKGAEADAKGLEKKVSTAQKDVDTLTKAQLKVSENAASLKAKLAAVRDATKANPGKPKARAVGAGDVKKARGAEGDAVPLKYTDVKKFFDEVSAQTMYPKVAELAGILREHINGIGTDAQTLKKLAGVIGEKKK